MDDEVRETAILVQLVLENAVGKEEVGEILEKQLCADRSLTGNSFEINDGVESNIDEQGDVMDKNTFDLGERSDELADLAVKVSAMFVSIHVC